VVEDASTEETAVVVPEMAAQVANRFEFSVNQVGDQLVKSSGWLTATLLAVNGGAALAVLQGESLRSGATSSLWWFGAGLLFAMLNAFSIQTLASKSLRPLVELHLFWVRASLDGEYDRSALTIAERTLSRITRWAFVPPLIGWFSAACFVGGGMIFMRSLGVH
jgi:hypothetical protein